MGRAHGLLGDLQRFKAEYLKAMAHPVRIRILEVLRTGPASVADIQAQVDPSIANISQHLAVLRGAGIVTSHKVRATVHYAVRDAEVFVVLDALRSVFTERLDAMRSLLSADGEPPADADPRVPLQQ